MILSRPTKDAFRTMRKSLFSLAALLLLVAGTSLADTFRVHYSIRGSGRDITVQAESSAEARRTVMETLASRRAPSCYNMPSSMER